VTTFRVSPSRVHGSIRAPPSKSYTHRALVVGHLARRRFQVIRPLDADDTRLTARALSALGSRVRFSPHRWTVEPRAGRPAGSVTIQCGESGTTLRFVAALAALGERRVRLEGRGRLPHRPIAELFEALERLGATVDRRSATDGLPATIAGPLEGGVVRLDASQSSQFVSALLLSLPTVSGDSELRLEGPIVSEPYIEATLAVLRRSKVRLRRTGRTFAIPGRQTYRGDRFVVPGDASSSAYLWAAAALTRGRVRVGGVPRDLPQADLASLEMLRSAGALVRMTRDGATVVGRALRGFSIDLTAAPDLYPLAGVLAAAARSPSKLSGASHVVHKESDRRAGTVLIARALGATVRPTRTGLSIRGRSPPTRFRLRGLDDHRLVMSAAVGALGADGPSTIADASVVAKSFPGFWDALRAIAREGPK